MWNYFHEFFEVMPTADVSICFFLQSVLSKHSFSNQFRAAVILLVSFIHMEGRLETCLFLMELSLILDLLFIVF